MANDVSLAVRVSANLDDLRARLAEGQSIIDTTSSAMKAMANAYDGAKTIANANAAFLQVQALGGVASLTESEQARLNATLQAGIDKYSALGKTAPSALQDMADATNSASGATTGWMSILSSLGGSFVARVAEGQLLRDAIRALITDVKDAAEAFPDMVERSVELGNSIFEMSMKTGASVEGLSALRYVVSQTGIDFNSFGTTLSMMEKNLGATGAAGAKVSAALTEMGLDITTVKNMRSDEAFIAIAQGLEGISNNADKASAAALLMGRGAAEMAALWHEDIGQMLQDAQNLGLVMSTETAAGAHLAEIGFQSLKMQMDALEMSISNAFIPAIIGIEADLGTGLHNAVMTLNGSLSALGGEGGALSVVARAMGTGGDAINAQVQLYNYLKEGLIAVARDGIEPAITAIGALAGGFNGAKVVFGDVMQVIQGDALAFEYLAKGVADVGAALGNSEAAADVKRIDDSIQTLLVTMKARGDALQADKQAESDWSAWAVNANAAVEVALKAVGDAHTDVKVKIQEMADVSEAAYGGVSDAVDNSAATLKKHATDQSTAFKTEEGQLAEIVKAYDAYEKAVQAGSHDTLQTQITDAELAADTKIAALEKAKTYTHAAEMYIRDEANQTAANLVEKYLETDKYTAEHYQLIADKAKEAFDFALDHVSSYSAAEIMMLRDAYQEAEQASNHWAQTAASDMDKVKGSATSTAKAVSVAALDVMSTLSEADAALDADLTATIRNVETLSGAFITAAQAKAAFDSGGSYQIDTIQVTAANKMQLVAELQAIEAEYAEYPGRQQGQNGPTGLASNDAAGWTAMLKEQARYAALKAALPGYAEGVTNAPGGWAMVGEKGPEPMYVPKGATVLPTGSQPGGVTMHIYVTQPLGTPQAIAKVVGDAWVKYGYSIGLRQRPAGL